MVNLPNLPPPPKHPNRLLEELLEKRDRLAKKAQELLNRKLEN